MTEPPLLSEVWALETFLLNQSLKARFSQELDSCKIITYLCLNKAEI
jgi:hypothetical protein